MNKRSDSYRSKRPSTRPKRAMFSRSRDGRRLCRDVSASLAHAKASAAAASKDASRAHARLMEAIEILPHGLVFLDAEGRYILWNRQYADIYRKSADLFAPGARLEETLRVGVARGDYPDAVGREEQWIAERLSYLLEAKGRHEQRLSDGRTILIEERRTSDGGVIGLRVDITELKEREASFRLLFDENPVPMFVCRAEDGQILSANAAALSHYGYPGPELLATRFHDIAADVGKDGQSPQPEAGGGSLGRTQQHRRADGTLIDVAAYVRELTYGGVPAVLISAIDVTERKRAEAQVAFLALHDSLTALPNRTLLRIRMDELLDEMRKKGDGLAVLYFDLDNFKSVNDTLGHPAGDLLLCQIAERACGLLREDDVIARLGGDEFAILQPQAGRPRQAMALAQRLLDRLSMPFDVDGQLVSTGASIGISMAPADGNDPDRLLKNADLALYRAKAEGKNTFRFFEEEMDADAHVRREMELDLRLALEENLFEVHYQPLVDLSSSRVKGFEALIRWPHPRRGMVAPADFIPLAEETGLISRIGAFVLRRACLDAAAWPEDIRVAVNLSPQQFRYGDILGIVMEALKESGLAASRLELEITEAFLLEKSEKVIATLHALRALGVRIVMDDFGTGYSSLSYLRSFPFDKIKIDRSFVTELSSSPQSQAIVRAVISLGTTLGMSITAEGIEELCDLESLRNEGCNEGQGFFFSAACPAAEVAALLETLRSAAA